MVKRTRKSQETEEQIFEAALTLFSEQGYSGTSTSQIASAAGVSEGTIFKYFPKKMDLLRRIVYAFIERNAQTVVMKPIEEIFEKHKQDGPKEVMRAIIIDRIQLFKKMSPFVKVIFTEIQYHEEIQQIFTERILIEMKRFSEEIYGYYKSQGIFRDIPAFLGLRSFIGMVMLMILQRQIAPELNEEGLSLEDEIEIIIDLYLNGIMEGEKNVEINA